MDVDGPFMFTKWWTFTTTKTFSYIINIYFKLKKNWIRFMMISKIELKCFQMNLMLELFMCLSLKLLELFKKNYSLGVTSFFSNFWSQLFGKCFVFYIFPWICTIFSIFSRTNSKPKKHVRGGGGWLIQKNLTKIFSKLNCVSFYKKDKSNIYSYIIIYIFSFFFSNLCNYLLVLMYN